MGYHEDRKCPICGNQMTRRLTKPPVASLICTHPHTVAMIDEFLAGTGPLVGAEGDNNEGTKGSNHDG